MNRSECRLRRRSVLPLPAVVAIFAAALCSGCAGLGKSGLSTSHRGPCPEATCLETDVAVDAPKAGVVAAHRCVDPLPHDAVPAPAGTYVNAWSETMASRADAQGEIITRNLWFDGGRELGPDGQERMVLLAESFVHQPRLILIEEEPVAIDAGQSYAEALQANADLNADRKAAVVDTLASLGVEGAGDLVYFTTDRGVGVRGIEAPNVFNRQFMGGMGGRGGGMMGGGMMGGGMFGGGMMGGGMMGGGMMGGGMFGGGGIF